MKINKQEKITLIFSLILLAFFIFGFNIWMINPIEGVKKDYLHTLITWSLTLTGLSLASAIFNSSTKKPLINKKELFALTYTFLLSSILFIGSFALIGIVSLLESFQCSFFKICGDFMPTGIFQIIWFKMFSFFDIWFDRIIVTLGLAFFSLGLIKILFLSKSLKNSV